VTLPADTVIFSIGSQVDPGFGLPIANGHFLTTPVPRYPVDGISYEVYNPELCVHCEDIFVSGWARLASEGIVGLARKDAERGAKALLVYLKTLDASQSSIEDALRHLPKLAKTVVDEVGLEILWEEESRIAFEMGRPEFKFGSNEEMLTVIERGSQG